MHAHIYSKRPSRLIVVTPHTSAAPQLWPSMVAKFSVYDYVLCMKWTNRPASSWGSRIYLQCDYYNRLHTMISFYESLQLITQPYSVGKFSCLVNL